MKLLLLSDANSSHTTRWVLSLAEKNIDIVLFSLSQNLTDNYKEVKNIRVQTAGIPRSKQLKDEADSAKLAYLYALRGLKKIIKEFKPDIVHAHYATSYGLLGALSRFHPYVLSVWGSDIISFPNKSFLHKKLLMYNLNKADNILATSKYLAEETSRYTSKKIDVTPFGIDTEMHKPGKVNHKNDGEIVIGTVKSMEDNYGIEYLVKAFKVVHDKMTLQKLKLLLVGEGSRLNYYKMLAKELGIENDVIFAGKVSHQQTTEYHNMMDIEVYVSFYESFGVAVLEASACENPVIVSNTGGLREIVENNKTGLFVEPKNIQQTAAAIETLINDEGLRKSLGKNGRKKVIEEYSWNESVDKMLLVYKNILEKKKNL